MLLGTGLASILQEVPEPQSLESPLPGGFATVVRFFLNFPQPLQIAGVVLGVVLALVAVFLLWRYRGPVRSWLVSRPRSVYAAAGGIAVLALFGGVWAGFAGWSYVEHDNGFCTGCHVMGPSFVRFTESEHSELECHDCHQQSVFASMRQLYLWVAERPEDIGPHSPVPTGVCAACHLGEGPTVDESWERIASTQGHAVHLESEHADLADVQCVTCHAPEVHRFAPAEETCGQSGCHVPAETQITLGEMAGAETTFHCVGCHEFAAPLESGASPLLPSLDECAACHERVDLIAELGAETDPHGATCGSCHNPHDQPEAGAAVESCTAAGCHDGNLAELTSFHRGLHHGILGECSTCHEAHGFVVDGEDCQACHTDLR